MADMPAGKGKAPEGLNLTPFIDMITCLMFFLLMFAGIIPVALIDAPLPKIASTAAETQKAKDQQKQLNLTILLTPTTITVKGAGVGDKSFSKGPDGKFPLPDLRKHLVELKQKSPESTDVTLVPEPDVVYEALIAVMDTSRDLKQGDPGFQATTDEIAKTPEGMKFNALFPDVSIGGI